MATKEEWERVDAFIDGKRVILDGIEGTLQVLGSRPYRRFYHQPTAKGRTTEVYRLLKQKFRDDWSSDLTNSDRLVEIMSKLGVNFKGGHIIIPAKVPSRAPVVGSAAHLLANVEKHRGGGGAHYRRGGGAANLIPGIPGGHGSFGTLPTMDDATSAVDAFVRGGGGAKLDAREVELLVDTAREPIRRRMPSNVVYDRLRKSLAERGLIRWHHVTPGSSSFADHYVLTAAGQNVLRPGRGGGGANMVGPNMPYYAAGGGAKRQPTGGKAKATGRDAEFACDSHGFCTLWLKSTKAKAWAKKHLDVEPWQKKKHGSDEGIAFDSRTYAEGVFEAMHGNKLDVGAYQI
jgi:hypothetical protein